MEPSTAYDDFEGPFPRGGPRTHVPGENLGRAGASHANNQNPDVIVRAAQKRRSSIENSTNNTSTV